MEMNIESGKVYTMWDNKLNEIWKVLETQLPKSTMDSLRTKQNAWIKVKESKKQEIQKEYEGGSMMPLMVNSAWSSMTEERCYYLVNNYM
ncbi:MAG: lysozyme inhibitor LprI family protein [Clostridium sp.]